MPLTLKSYKQASDAVVNIQEIDFEPSPNPSLSYHLLYAQVTYVASGATGDRHIALSLKDDVGDTIYIARSVPVQKKSTTREYTFKTTGGNRETVFRDDSIEIILPEKLILLPRWTLTIEDLHGVDSANDTMSYSAVANVGNLGSL